MYEIFIWYYKTYFEIEDENFYHKNTLKYIFLLNTFLLKEKNAINSNFQTFWIDVIKKDLITNCEDLSSDVLTLAYKIDIRIDYMHEENFENSIKKESVVNKKFDLVKKNYFEGNSNSRFSYFLKKIDDGPFSLIYDNKNLIREISDCSTLSSQVVNYIHN